MDFSKMIGNIFQREQVPMNQSPSMVKLEEGEELVTPNMINEQMATPYQVPMPQGQGNDIVLPPRETNPLVQLRNLGLKGVDAMNRQVEIKNSTYDEVPKIATGIPDLEAPESPVVPEMFEESVIPPEKNETIKDLSTDEGIQNYLDQYNMESFGSSTLSMGDYEGVYGGYSDLQHETRNPKTRSRVIDENGDLVNPGNMEDIAEANKVRQRQRAIMEGKPVVDTDIDPSSITAEEAEQSQMVADELVTPQGPDGIPMVDSEPPVPTPSGGNVKVTAADVDTVKKEDPSGWAKAMSWINRTFGITGQDLNRFALLYVGSRIAGYDHGVSMSWSFGVAAEGLTNRSDISNRLAGQGKYTPKSIEKYRLSGNIGELVAVTDPAKSGVTYDRTKRKVTKNGKIVYEATNNATGNKTYIDFQGNEVGAEMVYDPNDPKDATGIAAIRKKSVDLHSKVITQKISADAEVEGEYNTPFLQASAEAEANIAEDYIESFRQELGIDVDSGVSSRIIANAYDSAKSWSQANGNAPVKSLLPFIDSQIVYMRPDVKWTQELRSNGDKLQPDQIAGLNRDIINWLSQEEEYVAKEGKLDRGTVINTFMTDAYKAYQALDPVDKNEYTKKDGFYSFLKVTLTTNSEK